MRLLIAIKSCVVDMIHGAHEVIRKTWGKDVIGADLRFFVGQPLETLREDEIVVNAKDDYHSLPFKTREILRWSVAQGYDYTCLADIDTYLILRLLVQYPFADADYVGIMLQEIARPLTLGKTFRYVAVDRQLKPWLVRNCYPWASGGLSYFLSRKAAELIIAREPDIWAEDLWVGQIMGEAYNQGKLTIKHACNFEGFVAFHFPHETHGKPYDPREGWMESMYEKYR